MIVSPVVPWLALATDDPSQESYDAPSVNVWSRIPAVTNVVKLPWTPLPALHVTELSEIQSVALHNELPSCTVVLYDAVPRSAPLTSTLACPAAATLPDV
eukprot:2236537-Rhodomonas_salina.2